MIGLEFEEVDSLRARAAQTGSAEDQNTADKAVSDLESILSRYGALAPDYVKALRATNSALADYVAAENAFEALLKTRDERFTQKYPDWRTWWVLITCSRHPLPHHLDFDTAVAN